MSPLNNAKIRLSANGTFYEQHFLKITSVRTVLSSLSDIRSPHPAITSKSVIKKCKHVNEIAFVKCGKTDLDPRTHLAF